MAKSKFNYITYLPVLALVVLFLYFMSQKESDKDAVIENMSTRGDIGIIALALAVLIVAVIWLFESNSQGENKITEIFSLLSSYF